MASLSPECASLKQDYDECFNAWYTGEFLQGSIEPECEDVFKKYKACVWRAIEEKKIDGLIQAARQDHPFEHPSAPAPPDPSKSPNASKPAASSPLPGGRPRDLS